MKRHRLIIAGVILGIFIALVLVIFRPWSTPMADEKSLKALFAEAHTSLKAYYSTNKAYPNSLKELKLNSPLAPYLKYWRTGNSSCRMLYFSLGDVEMDSSVTLD